ncbi:flagellar assembly protein FliW [Thiocystis violacea]|uniref:flagellar assembly protein FliW n=1 Tax=Thiocystis violacea TaxID=13725 RepID=UPI0019044716|nr:flagellar assembly protein FliW [Thiocystis violacea]MBK1720294.1 flagellar biosynthesis protein FliW [Thiocystis violacea]
MTQDNSNSSESVPSTDIVFPNGIPGFEDLKRYRLEHSDTESGRVYRMHSEDEPGIAFTLVDPRFYALNYVLELSDEEQSLLQAEGPEEIIVLLMLWKNEDPEPEAKPGLHANIDGPILINVAKCLGLQKIITSPRLALSISN